MNVIFEPKSPFVTAKAMDLMFDGIPINCDVHDFSAKAVCNFEIFLKILQKIIFRYISNLFLFSGAAFESESNQLQVVNETLYKFSLLGSVISNLYFSFHTTQ